MREPITVAHFIGSMDPGGAETLLIDLLTAMLPLGYRFKVFYLNGKGTLCREIEHPEIAIEFLDIPSEKQFWRLPDVALRLHRSKIQIVHTHVHISRYWLTPAAWLGGARAVFQTIHDTYQHRPGSLKYVRVLERINWLLATQQIAVSNKVRDFVMQEFRLPSKRLQVIYNGIRPNPLAMMPTTRSTSGLVESDFAIVTVANLTPQKKGYEILLPAFHEIKKQLPAAKLVIIGEGKLRPWLESWIHEHALENSVMLLGHRRDVRRILPQFNLFVLPSLWEGMPMSIIEAMFAGLPVIATDVGGNAELINDKSVGVLIPPGDPQELCRAVLALAENTEQRVQLGLKARARALNYFTIEKTAQQIHALYQKALGLMQESA